VPSSACMLGQAASTPHRPLPLGDLANSAGHDIGGYQRRGEYYQCSAAVMCRWQLAEKTCAQCMLEEQTLLCCRL
jgi:hypothetical protein